MSVNSTNRTLLHTALALQFLAAAALAPPPAQSQQLSPTLQAVRTYREANELPILTELRDFVTIPNVTADRANVRRNAEHLRRLLEKRGLTVQLFERAGANPLVVAERLVPAAKRTLVFYAHYDGQPLEPRADWKVDPWTPTLYTRPIEAGGTLLSWPPRGPIDPEWRLYGRASADDKAPIIAMLAGLDALAQSKTQPTSNLRFVFDGEEEIGSPNLDDFLREHPAELRGDAWLIFDGPTHQSRRPQLVFGVRGIATVELTVYGAASALHSGHYGNYAPNPALRLAHLLASMKDPRGHVLIDGFETSTEPLSERERQALAALPDFDAQLREELQIAESEGTPESYWQRLARPSLNIRGLSAGSVGEQATNSIPATATASIDIRLVRGNDPHAMVDLVVQHVKKQGYHVVDSDPDPATRKAHPLIAKITRETGTPAARTPLDSPLAKQIESAARGLSGDSLLIVPTMGGTLPLYMLNAPFIVVPTVNHDNHQHAPNENLRIANLWYAIDIFTTLATMD